MSCFRTICENLTQSYPAIRWARGKLHFDNAMMGYLSLLQVTVQLPLQFWLDCQDSRLLFLTPHFYQPHKGKDQNFVKVVV